MCPICQHDPCRPGCPNQEVDDQLPVCCKCGEKIRPKQYFYEDSFGECTCYDCMEKMEPRQLAEVFGKELDVA